MNPIKGTEQRLIIALTGITVVTGFIDAVSYVGLGHVFTANMTGNVALLGFEKKMRKTLDDAAEGLKGKPDAAAQMEKIADKQRKAIEAQAKILRKMDPSGGNSNIGTDHDVSLNALANDYPAALAAAAAGDEKPLAEVRQELDKRVKKMEAWLEEVKTSKETKEPAAVKPAKAAKAGKPGKKGKK